MSQSRVHLFSFTLVVVLYLCMIISLSVGASKVTVSQSYHNNDSEGSTTFINTSTLKNESTVETPADPDTSAKKTNNASTDTDNNSTTITTKESITEVFNTSGTSQHTPAESSTRGPTPEKPPTTKSTTLESTTVESTTVESTTAVHGGSGRVAGIVFLLCILFIIIILAIILHYLWKKGKRYSFDLTYYEHDTPLRSIEPTTFEPTKGSTIDLEYISEENPDKANHVANGCSGETPEETPSSDQQNVPEEDSYASDLSLSSPVKKVEFNLELDLIGADPDMEKQTTDQPTDSGNENNNNDMNTGNDSAELFTEIDLDDGQ